jgi:Signal transduction histidine kinase
MNKRNKRNKIRLSFSMRLFWSVFVIFLVFIICVLLFQYQREREYVQEKLNSVLTGYNHQLYLRLQQDSDYNATIEQFRKEIPQDDIRITIISSNGEVVYDNSGIENMTNHNDRVEVRKARLGIEAFTIRASGTTGRDYFYSASRIDNYIYRTALPYDDETKSILSIDNGFLYFMGLITLILLFVLHRFTSSIGRTISKLKNFTQKIDSNTPLEDYEFPDDELGDISDSIITLYNRLQKTKDALAMDRDKIIKHFRYSRDGFAMFALNSKTILSNALFIQYLNLISDTPIHHAEDALNISELAPIEVFLRKDINSTNRKKVLRESVTIDKGGKTFQIKCILFLDKTYELSIIDISRQEEETRMKRQLTQNIAHELKTPVSSIQGYLETIISNPDLQEDKKQFFIERCYSQSSRLTDLLLDISVLNRIDEASNMFELYNVDITNLINEIQKECSKEMEEKNITVDVSLPNNPTISGNYSLVYSIFRNLFDNAIAYAGENVKISITCYKEDSRFYYFSFSDNGIGIGEEHINRIFERFYRVDKGRSRKIGGTGLGLSIVKNGVLFHKGQISAKSSVGKGISFFFTLKKKL